MEDGAQGTRQGFEVAREIHELLALVRGQTEAVQMAVVEAQAAA